MTGTPADDFHALRRRIDQRLAEVLPQAEPGQDPLGDAMRDGVLAPGKRLRPLMTALVAEDLSGSLDAGVDAGCAVEMVHAASLVLDDLPCMDNATLRRGLPAVHVAHGEDVAVLVAIAALAGAYGLLSALPDVPAEARARAVLVLSDTVGSRGLVGGQFADLRGGRSARASTEIDTANALKTGSLFRASVELGGIVAGAGTREMEALRRFAAELGLAFQLLDDLLDEGPSAARLGKDVGQDRGKSTMVALIGSAPVRRRIERHVGSAQASLAAVFGPASRMEALTDMIFLAAFAQQGPERDAAVAAG